MFEIVGSAGSFSFVRRFMLYEFLFVNLIVLDFSTSLHISCIPKLLYLSPWRWLNIHAMQLSDVATSKSDAGYWLEDEVLNNLYSSSYSFQTPYKGRKL